MAKVLKEHTMEEQFKVCCVHRKMRFGRLAQTN